MSIELEKSFFDGDNDRLGFVSQAVKCAAESHVKIAQKVLFDFFSFLTKPESTFKMMTNDPYHTSVRPLVPEIAVVNGIHNFCHLVQVAKLCDLMPCKNWTQNLGRIFPVSLLGLKLL